MNSNDFDKKMTEEQSHMEKREVIETPAPTLMECVRDLLDEIAKRITDDDCQNSENLSIVCDAADRVEAALKYDKPEVLITVGGDNGDGNVEIESKPTWINVHIVDCDTDECCPECDSSNSDGYTCLDCGWSAEDN